MKRILLILVSIISITSMQLNASAQSVTIQLQNNLCGFGITRIWAMCPDDCNTMYELNYSPAGPMTTGTYKFGGSGVWYQSVGGIPIGPANPPCSNMIVVGIAFYDCAGIEHVIDCLASIGCTNQNIAGSVGQTYSCDPANCNDDWSCCTSGPVNVQLTAVFTYPGHLFQYSAINIF